MKKGEEVGVDVLEEGAERVKGSDFRASLSAISSRCSLTKECNVSEVST